MQLQTSTYWKTMPTPRQTAALTLSQVETLFFGGAAGGGKSEYLLMAASQFADFPDSNALLVRQTTPQLVQPGGLWDRALHWWAKEPRAKISMQDKIIRFDSGSSIKFGHMDNSKAHYQYDGAEYSMIGIDEASNIPEFQITYLYSRLRTKEGSKVPKMFRMASNPGGESHFYLRDNYVKVPNTHQRVFLPSRLTDNPHLKQEEYKVSLQHMSPVERERKLHGDWDIQPEGNMFDRDKIGKVDEAPAGCRVYRSWDLAETAPKDTNKTPDRTAGVKVGYKDGVFYILDVVVGQWNPDDRNNIMRRTAIKDGVKTPILIEQAGNMQKTVHLHLTRHVFEGFQVYPHETKGRSKTERAQIMATPVANENVKIVKAAWNAEFLDEFGAFPEGVFDDIVDACAQAFDRLYVKPSPVAQFTFV